MRMDSRRVSRFKLFTFTLAIVFSATSCNLFTKFKLDDAKSDDELLAAAQAKMDAGFCAEAAQLIEKIKAPKNRAYRMLGWAKLCAGGAGLKKILTTMVTFTSGSTTNGSNTIGTLANSITPQSDLTITHFTGAIAAFAQQDGSNDRTVNLMMAFLMKASALIAKASTDGRKTYRTDISPAACIGIADCIAGAAACTAANMSDIDANTFVLTINAAGTAVTAGLGSVGSLAADLVGKVPAGASAATARCVIVNSLLTQ